MPTSKERACVKLEMFICLIITKDTKNVNAHTENGKKEKAKLLLIPQD